MLAAIRGKDIVAFIKERQAEGAGPNTVRLDLAVLSHLFNVARTAWGMESLSNPVQLVKGRRPKLPGSRKRRLVGDEEARLLAAAAAYGGEIGPIITWAIETAMRRSEIVGMRWEQLNLPDRTFLLLDTKNGEEREVPLSKKAITVLPIAAIRLTLSEQFPLMTSYSRSRRVWNMMPDSISQAFERVCAAAGIEGLTFHDLRHEAASRFTEKGLNQLEAKAITGHKTIQMLADYTHLKAKDLAEKLG